jgi:hypothetical protein
MTETGRGVKRGNVKTLSSSLWFQFIRLGGLKMKGPATDDGGGKKGAIAVSDGGLRRSTTTALWPKSGARAETDDPQHRKLSGLGMFGGQ